MPYPNTKKPNSYFRSTVEHLPAALMAHGIFKTAEKIVESYSEESNKSERYNKSNAKNNRFKP